MPYQWFFWKAALNDGEASFAWQIAEQALALWEQETRESYACHEQFSISSGRGSGWHHFSALTAPVLNWAAAYFAEKRLTVGYDVTIHSHHTDKDATSWELHIDGDPGTSTTLLFVHPSTTCHASYQGQPCPVYRRIADAWEITLPKATSGILQISRQR